MTTDELRAMVMGQAQGAAALNLAFVGVANGLFAALAQPRSVEELAEHSGLDLGYLRRWCEAVLRLRASCRMNPGDLL
jgi:hypothetical protein